MGSHSVNYLPPDRGENPAFTPQPKQVLDFLFAVQRYMHLLISEHTRTPREMITNQSFSLTPTGPSIILIAVRSALAKSALIRQRQHKVVMDHW